MKPIRHSHFVHFDEGDPAGIAFFATYFRWAHQALELNLEAAGIAWSEWFDHREWGVPLRHVEADFHGPVLPGTRVELVQSVVELGESSVTLQTEIVDPSQKVLAVVKTVHVFVDKSTRKKRAIPEHLRNFLSAQ